MVSSAIQSIDRYLKVSKKEQLLDIAEGMVRLGGYNSVSFRTLAEMAGIKSASVHYHFPTKEDLGAALADRYTEKFLLTLGDAKSIVSQGSDPINFYVQMFRKALTVDKKMCLCGMLGAEFDGLPNKVRLATQTFFERNIDWLTNAYRLKHDRDEKQARDAAISLLSQLEGALMMSIALKDDAIFDIAINNRH